MKFRFLCILALVFALFFATTVVSAADEENEPTDEPVDESIDEPADESIDEPIDEPVDESVEPVAEEEPVDEEEPVNEEEPVAEEEPVDAPESSEEPVSSPTSQPAPVALCNPIIGGSPSLPLSISKFLFCEWYNEVVTCCNAPGVLLLKAQYEATIGLNNALCDDKPPVPEKCEAQLRFLFCMPCNPEQLVGKEQYNKICRGFRDRIFDACQDAYLPSSITIDALGNSTVSVGCSKFSEYFPDKETFEEKFILFAGYDFVDGSDTSKCFNAATSLAPVSLIGLVALMFAALFM